MIKPTLAYAVVNRDKPRIDPYWLLRQRDLPDLYLSKDEELLTVIIQPLDTKSTTKKNVLEKKRGLLQAIKEHNGSRSPVSKSTKRRNTKPATPNLHKKR